MRLTRLASAAASAQADAVAALLNGGSMRFYDGERMPVEIEPAAQPILTLRFGNPAFRSAASGVIVANEIAAAKVDRSGKASWFRCYTADGRAVLDGTIGLMPELVANPSRRQSYDIVTEVTDLPQGATFKLDSYGYSVPLEP